MKHIIKGKEPQEFIDWKAMETENWKPTFNDLSKRIVRGPLLQDQGFICCYCEIRLTDSPECQIEHIKPKGEFPELELEYTNFLACCLGGSHDNPTTQHCGQKKNKWYDPELFVSPLNPDCESYFTYTLNGEIKSSDDTGKQAATNETISKLGLNIQKLKDSRKSTIDAELGNFDKLNEDEAKKLIVGYQQRDTEDHFIRHYSAVVCILKQYFALD